MQRVKSTNQGEGRAPGEAQRAAVQPDVFAFEVFARNTVNRSRERRDLAAEP